MEGKRRQSEEEGKGTGEKERKERREGIGYSFGSNACTVQSTSEYAICVLTEYAPVVG